MHWPIYLSKTKMHHYLTRLFILMEARISLVSWKALTKPSGLIDDTVLEETEKLLKKSQKDFSSITMKLKRTAEIKKNDVKPFDTEKKRKQNLLWWRFFSVYFGKMNANQHFSSDNFCQFCRMRDQKKQRNRINFRL